SAIFLAVSLRFIWYVFTPRYPRRAIVHETELGEVYVALDAIENLVKKVARQVKGVREVKAKVENNQGGIAIYIRAVVTPETSIPDASLEIQNVLKRYVRDVVGVAVAQTRIAIVNIAGESRRGRAD
ncbi:MAG: alkaline shock response membrane anchor protein AmaP, partial [Actinobacteria bacterium]|nr:alkaline shock response membrane anchor protein AmaP [Actinomycetota bacterium]